MSEETPEISEPMVEIEDALEEDSEELVASPTGEGGDAAAGEEEEETLEEETEPTKYKVKVDGEEIEVTLEDMQRDYQLRRASDKKFQDAAAIKAQAEEFLEALRTDPRKVLEHPNINADIRALAEEILSEQLEDEMLDPKDREIKKLQRELEAREAEKKAEEDAKTTTKQKAEEAELLAGYEKQIDTALSTSGLPNTSFTIDRMAYYMQQAVRSGYDLTAADVVPLVKEDYINDFKKFFAGSDDKVIAEILGGPAMKKIRKMDLSTLKDPKGKTPANQPDVKPRAKGEKQTFEDFFEALKDDMD